MIKQTNNLLKGCINKSGCYFMSLCALAMVESKKSLLAQEVNLIYELAVGKKYIDKNCTVEKPDQLLSLIYQILDIDKVTWQVGTIVDGEYTYWQWVKDKYPQWIDHNKFWIVRELKTNTSIGTHFLLCDWRGYTFYDPETRKYAATGITKDVLYHTV